MQTVCSPRLSLVAFGTELRKERFEEGAALA